MLVVWGSSSKGGFNFIFEMIFVQRKKSLNLYGLRLIGPKLWNELDERFKCRTSNQFKKKLTLHYWYFDGSNFFLSFLLSFFFFVLYIYFYAKLWPMYLLCLFSDFHSFNYHNYSHPTSLAFESFSVSHYCMYCLFIYL